MYREVRSMVQALFVFPEVMTWLIFDYSRKNKRWRRLRRLALNRDKDRCREAARYGLSREAQVVHHIWPAEDYPEYAYCLWNLVSLSQAAHDAIPSSRPSLKATATACPSPFCR